MKDFGRTLWNNIRLDAKVAWRNGFFLITIALVFAFAAVVRWVIPPTLEVPTPPLMLVDQTEDHRWKAFFAEHSAGAVIDQILFFDDVVRMEAQALHHGSIGAVVGEEGIRLILQGYEHPKSVEMVKGFLRLTDQTLRGSFPASSIQFQTLNEERAALPMNVKVIPILLATDVLLMAFFLVAAMVFNEKKEGSLYAYRVSPGGILSYLLSKVVVNVGNCMLFSILLLVLTGHGQIDYLAFFSLVILASASMSFFGLLIAQFYDSLMEFIYVILGVMFIAMLPALPLFNPNIASPIFEWIPSYAVIFGTLELLERVDPFSWNRIIPLVLLLAVMVPLVWWSFGRTTLKKHAVRAYYRG